MTEIIVSRSGWQLGIAAVLTNVVASLILVPPGTARQGRCVAIFLFKDKI